MPLSEKTLKILAETGWREGYSVDPPEETLRQRSYFVSDAARAFLSAFGHLHYYCEPEQRKMTVFHTRAADAARKLGSAGLASARDFFGVKLCPLGEAGFGFYIVFMDPHGRVFGVNMEGQYGKWADGGETLLECACCGGGPATLSDADRIPLQDDRWVAAPRPLAPHVERMVIRARFNAGRPRATYEFEKDLQELGCEVLDSARHFLTQYGGLTFEHKFATHNSSLLFHTDADAACVKVTLERIAPWERFLNAKLCPVGEAGYENYVLLMDDHGRTFGLDQHDALTRWAESPEELIESLCCSSGIIPVDESDRWPDADYIG